MMDLWSPFPKQSWFAAHAAGRRAGLVLVVSRWTLILALAFHVAGCATTDSNASESNVAADTGAEKSGSRFTYTQIIMGVRAEITLYAAEESKAIEAARAAFGRMVELERVMSDYQVDSELMNLCRTHGEDVPVSADLFDILHRSGEFHQQTDGAFDASIGPVVRLWRAARRSGALPTDEARRDALQRSGWQRVHLDPDARTVRLDRPGMQLDLGGIGKGYAAQEAVDLLRSLGHGQVLVNLGGDLVAGDPPPSLPGWVVGVDLDGNDEVTHQLTFANAAVATSGSAFQSVTVDGVQYSHIVDPTTGLGLTHRAAVLVHATDGATADALASAFSVADASHRRLIAARFPGVSIIIEVPSGPESGTQRTILGPSLPVRRVAR